MDLSAIHFHDTEITAVRIHPNRDEVAFEVSYPVDWAKNRFAPRLLVFVDAVGYQEHEGAIWGNPVILGVTASPGAGGRVSLRIETNAGFRKLQCRAVELKNKNT